MSLSINFDNLVRQLLPPHKRQPVRLMLLQAFIRPIADLFADFRKWRSNTRMMVNVNSQVKVFESYLRQKYNEPIQIKIVTFDDGLLAVGLEREGATMMPGFGLADEDYFVEVPLVGEIRDRFGDTDFIVYIPPQLDIILIQAEIEKYKQVLIDYKIIQEGVSVGSRKK